MKAKLSQTNTEKESLELPEELFNIPFKNKVVYQVATSMQKNKRRNDEHTKDREAVKGGGAKPWPQKGTGRARHGSIRSPLWQGGGVTFGPIKERNLKKKINKKTKRKALKMVLSKKLTEEEIFFVEKIKASKGKTQNAKKWIEAIIPEPNKKTLVVTPENNKELRRATNNLPHYTTMRAQDANALKLLRFQYLIISKSSVQVLKDTFLK